MRLILGVLARLTPILIVACDDETEPEPQQPDVVLQGGLGRATFTYGCSGPSDPQCDLDADLAPLREASPFPLLAVGSKFQLTAEGTGYGALTLDSGSSGFLAVDADGVTVTASRAGIVAVVAAKDGTPVDFANIELVEPAGLKILQATPQGSFTGVDIDFGNGEVSATADVEITFKFRAIVTDDDDTLLAGALPCTWTTSDPDVARITSDPADNIVTVVSGQSGTAVISVTYGDFTGQVTVEVGT